MRAQPLSLREGDRDVLTGLTRSRSVPAGLARRARVVLLAADGVSNVEIAGAVGVSRPTVNLWRSRYASSGVPGLDDQPKTGRPRTVDRGRILSATLMPPPARLGITHWSSRLLAAYLKIDATTVLRTWRFYGVRPWRCGTFTFSTEPKLVAKITDVVGLYLAPLQNAIVLCVDAKLQTPAVDRTKKMLPMPTGPVEKRTQLYVQHGTSTLFAALDIASDKVTGAVQPRYRRPEFLAFLKQLARAYPDRQMHLVLDSYTAHQTPEVQAWLAAQPRIAVHFTPTSGSWLNLVSVNRP